MSEPEPNTLWIEIDEKGWRATFECYFWTGNKANRQKRVIGFAACAEMNCPFGDGLTHGIVARGAGSGWPGHARNSNFRTEIYVPMLNRPLCRGAIPW